VVLSDQPAMIAKNWIVMGIRHIDHKLLVLFCSFFLPLAIIQGLLSSKSIISTIEMIIPIVELVTDTLNREVHLLVLSKFH